MRRKYNGAKYAAEAADSRKRVVEERSSCSEDASARCVGAAGSENADMSSDKEGENPSRRKPKGSCPRTIRAGLVGP